jgi:hypothetical protein
VFKVPTGARSGINGPINLVAYQGVAEGSVITLSGWTNYQLVPNPVLRQNLPVKYNQVDFGDTNWCKTVLGNRVKFGLRSIWNLKEYDRARPALAEMAVMDKGIHAQAWSFGDTLNRIKSVLGPILRVAAPIVNELASGPFIGSSKALAASGNVVKFNDLSYAASGDFIRAKACDASLSDVKPLELQPQTYRALALNDPRVRAFALHRVKRGAIQQRDSRQVAFPVVVMNPEILAPLAVQLYLASDVQIQPFGQEYRSMRDGYFIQGMDDQVLIPLNRNIYLLPIDPAAFALGKIVAVKGHPVAGRSLEAAVSLVCRGKFQGVLPYPITGAVEGDLVQDNDAFTVKRNYLQTQGLPLAGNDEDADIRVENLSEVHPGRASRVAFRSR